MTESAAKMIESNQNNVAFLSITGPEKTGKSFLMGHILGVPRAFDDSSVLQSEHHPVINIFSEPLGLEKNNQVFDVYLLDCQGFGKSSEYDAQIFSIAILMSSMVIYNQKGPISNSSIEKMSFCQNILKQISEQN